MVKLLSGDEEWRNLTAMDEYYQNGPLPTWIGWYAEHLPHWFHAATAAGTLVMELGIVLMLFFPRRVRLICFFIVTPWEIGVILRRITRFSITWCCRWDFCCWMTGRCGGLCRCAGGRGCAAVKWRSAKRSSSRSWRRREPVAEDARRLAAMQ